MQPDYCTNFGFTLFNLTDLFGFWLNCTWYILCHIKWGKFLESFIMNSNFIQLKSLEFYPRWVHFWEPLYCNTSTVKSWAPYLYSVCNMCASCKSVPNYSEWVMCSTSKPFYTRLIIRQLQKERPTETIWSVKLISLTILSKICQTFTFV